MMSTMTMEKEIEPTISAAYSLMDNVVVAKTAAIIVLSISSGIAGFLPIKLNDHFRSRDDKPRTFDKMMSFMLNFGGGVLICTVFLHLLPEIRSNVATLEKENIINQFALSYPELIMCIGFFMMFFVEETVHSFLMRTNHKDNTNMELCEGRGHDGTIAAVDNDVFVIAKTEIPKKNDFSIAIDQLPCPEHKCIANECPHTNYSACENGDSNHCYLAASKHQDSESHSHLPANLRKPSLNSLLTVLALSVHEIFEGLAVGLEGKTEMVWYLLAAVSCHKVVLAAFIGIQLLSSDVRKSLAYGYVVGFALTSPLGIFIGLVVSENSHFSETLSIVSVILQAMATGTLLYVVFFEVFRKQFGNYRISGFMRLVASVLGFIFMICIQVLLKDKD